MKLHSICCPAKKELFMLLLVVVLPLHAELYYADHAFGFDEFQLQYENFLSKTVFLGCPRDSPLSCFILPPNKGETGVWIVWSEAGGYRVIAKRAVKSLRTLLLEDAWGPSEFPNFAPGKLKQVREDKTIESFGRPLEASLATRICSEWRRLLVESHTIYLPRAPQADGTTVVFRMFDSGRVISRDSHAIVPETPDFKFLSIALALIDYTKTGQTHAIENAIKVDKPKAIMPDPNRLFPGDPTSGREPLLTAGDNEVQKGNLDAALTEYEKVVVMNDKSRYPLDWADSQSRIVFVLLAQGNPARALALEKEVVPVYEHLLSPDSAKLSQALSMLGYLYAANGRQEDAAPLYLRALAIDERVRPSHDYFGTLIEGMARYPESWNISTRLLKVQELAYGEKDPRICPTLDVIAEQFSAAKLMGEALPYYRRSIRLKQKAEFARTHQPVSATLFAQPYSEALRSMGWTPEQIAAELEALKSKPAR